MATTDNTSSKSSRSRKINTTNGDGDDNNKPKRAFGNITGPGEGECKYSIPKKYRSLYDALLFLTKESENPPTHTPFRVITTTTSSSSSSSSSSENIMNESKIASIFVKNVLEVLTRYDTTSLLQNFFIWMMEQSLTVCRPIAANVINVNVDENKNTDNNSLEQKESSNDNNNNNNNKKIGIICNQNILVLFIGEWLQLCKLNNYSNHILLWVMLRIIDMALALAKNDKEKESTLQQIPQITKVLDQICLLWNGNNPKSVIKKSRKFLCRHPFLIAPLWKICQSSSDKYSGAIEIIIYVLQQEKYSALWSSTLEGEIKQWVMDQMSGKQENMPMKTRHAVAAVFKALYLKREAHKEQTTTDPLWVELERMLKRKTQWTMKLCLEIFKIMDDCDLTAYGSLFGPLIIQEMRHDDGSRRQVACQVLKYFSLTIKQEKVFAELITVLGSHLKGDKGLISQYLCKMDLIQGFISLHQSLQRLFSSNPTADAHLRALACDVLVNFLEKETHVKCRAAAYEALGLWVSSPLPSVLAMLRKCLSGKWSRDHITYHCSVELMIQMLNWKTMEAQMQEIRNELKNDTSVVTFAYEMIQRGCNDTKENGSQGLAAITLLIELSKGSVEFWNNSKKHWLPLVIGGEESKSYVTSNDHILSSLERRDNILRLQILRSLFLHESLWHLLEENGIVSEWMKSKGIWEMTIWLLLSPTYKTRQEMKEILSEMFHRIGDQTIDKRYSINGILCNILQKYVFELKTKEVVNVGDTEPIIPLPSQFAHCLRAISGNIIRKDAIVPILVLSHHPWFDPFTNDKHRNLLWKRICNTWRKQTPDYLKILVDNLRFNVSLFEMIRGYLTSSKHKEIQESVTRMLGSIFELGAQDLIINDERIIASIDSTLKGAQEVLEWNNKDIAICKTPEGVLCVYDESVIQESAIKSEKSTDVIKIGSKRKKKKNPAPKDEKKESKLNDKDWEEKVRRELAEKSGEAEKERQNEIMKQKEIRDRCNTIRFRLDCMFSLFNEMIYGNKEAFADTLALKYLEKLLPLSRSELLRPHVLHGVAVICRSFSESIANNCDLVAVALADIDVYGLKAFDKSECVVIFEYCINTLKKAIHAPDVHALFTPKHRKVNKGKGAGATATTTTTTSASASSASGAPAPPVAGRGRAQAVPASSLPPAQPGQGRGRGRGRGEAAENVAGATLPGSGRGRGVPPPVARPEVIAETKSPENPDEDTDMDAKSDTPLQLEIDTAKRWNNPSFVALSPLLRACILANKRDKKQKPTKAQLKLAGLAMSLVVVHCHGSVNVTTNKKIRFPSQIVSLLLLRTIATHPTLQKVAAHALRELSPAMTEESEIEDLLNKEGLLHDDKNVRLASLQALLVNRCILYPQTEPIRAGIYIACQDLESPVKKKALQIWKTYEFKLDGTLVPNMISKLGVPSETVRLAIAQAIALALQSFPENRSATIEDLIKIYISHPNEVINVAAPDDMSSGKTRVVDRSPHRHGVSVTLMNLCTSADLEQKNVMKCVNFLLKYGLYEETDRVFRSNLEIGRKLISAHGQKYAALLFETFDRAMNNIKSQQTEESDVVRQGLVIFMGCLVAQIDESMSDEYHKRIDNVMTSLLEVLKTPSHEVQFAVANALEYLIQKPLVSTRAPEYVNRMLRTLTESNKFPERRGAAIGIAAVVKGLGIPSVSNLHIMDSLNSAIQNTNSMTHREGALLCYNRLFEVLGRSFEPYVVKILPHLLNCFGDSNNEVRRATSICAKTIMKNLSTHGIKMVLPLVLLGLSKNEWHTKVQSANMLGSMAECNSKVLASYLPQIIPALCAILIHPKKEVTNAGQNALQAIGTVVRNPEISQLTPLLLKAITSPGENTKKALEALINTSFTNVVDVPSLALVIPILTAAMRDRSSNAKKMAAQVIGGISSLIAEPKSLLPYVPELVEGVKSILCDPIPEVRTAAALALRSLNESLEEEVDTIQNVLEWLHQLLEDKDCTNVQRFGAAEGYAEVLASYGTEKVEATLPYLLKGLKHPNPSIRESMTQVFVFLPKAFVSEFPQYLDQVVPPLLELLCDEKEPVRSVALQAGKIIVYLFYKTDYELLLDLLQDGMVHRHHLVREATVVLIGDLVHQLGGGKGSVTYETNVTIEFEKKVTDILGVDRRNEVFALIYMAKSDAEANVRQRAAMTWKGLVYNPSKMLKQILDTLMHMVITSLSSSNSDRQVGAGKALADLCSNAGQYIVPKIIPILSKGLENPDGVIRQGVCLGLAEVLSVCSKRLLDEYKDSIIVSIRHALCDDIATVRAASAQAFLTLVHVFKSEATEQVIPHLIQSLNSTDTKTEHVIEGLQEIVKLKSDVVLPYLIPTLLAKPLIVFHVKVLKQITPNIRPKDMETYIPDIVTTIIEGSIDGKEIRTDILNIGNDVLLGVNPDNVLSILRSLNDFVLRSRKNNLEMELEVSCTIISNFIKNIRCEETILIQGARPLIDSTLSLLIHRNERVRTASWNALQEIMSAIPEETLPSLIDWYRECLRRVVTEYQQITQTEEVEIPGFCIPKGMMPIMVMFDRGIRNGSFEERASAAQMMGEMIAVTNLEAIKLFSSKITGALVRVCGDHFPPLVKCPILHTLKLLLNKHGELLKLFHGPLHVTFLKLLQEPNKEIRTLAGEGMLILVKWSGKYDALWKDLNTLLSTNKKEEASATSSTMSDDMIVSTLKIVNELLVGKPVKSDLVKDLGSTMQELALHKNDEIRWNAAQAMGRLVCHTGPNEIMQLMRTYLADMHNDMEWRTQESHLITLASILEAGDKTNVLPVVIKSFLSELVSVISESLASEHMLVKMATLRMGYAALNACAEIKGGTEMCMNVLKVIIPFTRDQSSDLRQESAVHLSQFALKGSDFALDFATLDFILPQLLKGANDPVINTREAVHKAIKDLLRLDRDKEFCHNYYQKGDSGTVKALQNLIPKLA